MSTSLLILFIAIQFLALLLLAVLPFGFDHPSHWGLDFFDFLVMVAFYLLALICGVAVSIVVQRWWLTAMQILVGLAVAGILLSPWIFPPKDQAPVPPAEQSKVGEIKGGGD